ncbi:hypothetical protein D3C86_1446820 [compost metagenome]
MPRLSLVARSFSQLSMIIEVPAVQKPVSARSAIHDVSSMIRPVISTVRHTSATKEPNARTCPARRTMAGATKQPMTKPAAQEVPRKPRISLE